MPAPAAVLVVVVVVVVVLILVFVVTTSPSARRPIHFRSRVDGNEHVGEVVRNVELLGRRYLVVRTEPSAEDLRHGMKSIIHVYGTGYRNKQNDDIEHAESAEELHAGCRSNASSSGSTTGSSSSAASGNQAKAEESVEEPGLFMPDSNRFQQKELLGSGGFADVYKYVRLDASGRPTSEMYAVKEVDLQQLAWRVGVDQERLVRWVARLEFEVCNLLKLRGHPGVVKVHDAFAYRAKFYIVMEHVSGTDLARRLKGRGRLCEVEARGLFSQMAEALRHSHALDVIHRDFKPHNILLATSLRPGQPECVKLVDFGLSKDISGSSSGTSTPFLGTKFYRAPETRHATPGQESYDAAKVDVFALGVTLYAMLAGSHPPEGQEVTEQTLRGAAWQRVSPEASNLLLGLLKHEPEQRLSLDDVIEHPWLYAMWGAGAKSREVRASPQEPEPKSGFERDDEHEPPIGPTLPLSSCAERPSFQSAFPDAPTTSSAARIPTAGGSVQSQRPVESSGAPGWGMVFSWLRSDAAVGAAQQVLSVAGSTSKPAAAFGRTPLVSRGRGDAFGSPVLGASPPPALAVQSSPAIETASMSSLGQQDEQQRLLHSDDQAVEKEQDLGEAKEASGEVPPANTCRIKWVTCAARFSSVWRFSQAASRLLRPTSRLPSVSHEGLDGTTSEPSASLQSTRERRTSVIGFVQAPRLLAVDGAMVTITHSQRGAQGRAWGFVSETCRKHGFASREEAMRAAEEALKPPSFRPCRQGDEEEWDFIAQQMHGRSLGGVAEREANS
ncbi:unnamed protein product [Polarella glacialis]|uniref:Protein kinase domain-containing protein n=1 Tax=Polarella glacialis TaxID=89957 RepID=A0A813D4P2_POLGL|nr:unnamed protein product [Polarella glacialis]